MIRKVRRDLDDGRGKGEQEENGEERNEREGKNGGKGRREVRKRDERLERRSRLKERGVGGIKVEEKGKVVESVRGEKEG